MAARVSDIGADASSCDAALAGAAVAEPAFSASSVNKAHAGVVMDLARPMTRARGH
jgi:hypothetical protein